jgi:hypothetical protein
MPSTGRKLELKAKTSVAQTASQAAVYAKGLTLALDGVGVNAMTQPLYPRERPGTHFIGGWVGLRTELDRCGKSRPPPVFDPWTVKPVASRYTV